MRDRKIFVASDFIMTKNTEQISNLRWVLDILRRPIEIGTGIAPLKLFSDSSRTDVKFSREHFFKKCGITLNKDDTHFYYETKDVSEEAIAYVQETLGTGNFVVGYELSQQTRDVIVASGNHYIDMWLHPVRFYEDILFGFGSNNEIIMSRLEQFNENDAQFHLYADRLKVQAYKGWRRKELQLDPNSALFVGQTDNDKSVCQDGRFLNLTDFKDRFRELCETHDTVYYSEHPYLRKPLTEVHRFLAQFPNVEITTAPTYELISNENIKTVASISSSVLVEAGYFDKNVEMYFKPPFDYETYAAVYQKFTSPAFWAFLNRGDFRAQPASKTVAGEISPSFTEDMRLLDTAFVSSKDELRDMLGFYWAYGTIDKTEEMRTPAARKKKAHPLPSVQKAHVKIPFGQTKKDLEAAFELVDQHDVISFDIFDTLIERAIGQPNDVFHLLAEQLDPDWGIDKEAFVEARINSRKLGAHLIQPGSEEILLIDRHKLVAEELGYPEKLAELICQMELDLEEKVCQRRYAGWEIFQYAHAKGKKIILISDIFFTRDFVEKLLWRAGYEKPYYDALYLSSEEGALKHSGTLFDIVIEKEKLTPSKVLHVGDNPHADVKNGRKAGFNTLYLSANSNIVKARSTLMDVIPEFENRLASAAVAGLSISRFTRGLVLQEPGIANSQRENLGYIALGPIFFGMASWILREAKARNLDKVIFLARDGHIIKKCYDILAARDMQAPASEYVYASRRALRVAALETVEDLQDILNTRFSPVPVEKLFKKRFGIELSKARLGPKGLKSCGFASIQDVVKPDKDIDRLNKLLAHPKVSQMLLEHAAEERKELQAYYEQAGITQFRRIGYVDIGHSGTLQHGISKIMNLPRSTGFYFTTFRNVDDILESTDHEAIAYFYDRLRPSNKGNPYIKHILMFETAFLNDQPSFMRMKDGAPLFQDTDEGIRPEFARALHEGITDFCKDMVKTYGDFLNLMEMNAFDATAIFRSLLANPNSTDAGIFEGVSFENAYNGRDHAWVVAPRGTEDKSIWTEGEAAIKKLPSKTNYQKLWREVTSQPDWPTPKDFYPEESVQPPKKRPLSVKMMQSTAEFVIPLMVGSRKAEKFKLKTVPFFRDSNTVFSQKLLKIYEEYPMETRG